jgi:hypothetical protein
MKREREKGIRSQPKGVAHQNFPFYKKDAISSGSGYAWHIAVHILIASPDGVYGVQILII